MATDRSTVVGVFDERDLAERAVDDLHQAGFQDDQIGFVFRPGESSHEIPSEVPDDSAKGGVAGAIAGAGVGGFLGAAASLLLPGFGPILAGGILATILGGVAVGAATGGIIGALVDLGIPEDEARFYEDELNAGNIILSVKSGNRYDEARQILFRNGAYDVTDQQGLMSAGMDAGVPRSTLGRELTPDEMHNTAPSEPRGLRRDPDHPEEQGRRIA